DEPDGQRFPRGDGHRFARLFGMQALGRRADQIGARRNSQFVAASVIGGSSGQDLTVVQRFHYRATHWTGVWFARDGHWADRPSFHRSHDGRCGGLHTASVIVSLPPGPSGQVRLVLPGKINPAIPVLMLSASRVVTRVRCSARFLAAVDKKASQKLASWFI